MILTPVVVVFALCFLVVVPFVIQCSSKERKTTTPDNRCALRKGGCFRMGWWGFAKREQLLQHTKQTGAHARLPVCTSSARQGTQQRLPVILDLS